MATFWVVSGPRKEVHAVPIPPRLSRFLERQFRPFKPPFLLSKRPSVERLDVGVGVALDAWLRRQQRLLAVLDVPWLVRLCVNTLIGTAHFSVAELSPAPRKKSIEALGSGFGVTDAATVLHEYLEKLPDKLLAFPEGPAASEELLSALEAARVDEAATLLRRLPAPQRALLSELLYLAACALADPANDAGLSGVELLLGDALGVDKERGPRLLLALTRHWARLFLEADAPDAAFVNNTTTTLTEEEIGTLNLHSRIKLYTEDGASRIFKIAQNATAMDLLRSYKTKFKVAKVHLYEVQGRYVRPVILEESVHVLHERGAVLLVAQKMSCDGADDAALSDDPDAPPTPTPCRFLNAPLQLAHDLARAASPSPLASPRTFPPLPRPPAVASATAQSPPSPQKEFTVNIFTLPAQNIQKAAEWDTSRLQEARLTLFIDRGHAKLSLRATQPGAQTIAHAASQVRQVIDSSIHYAIVAAEAPYHICGFGFANRAQAGEFKIALCEMLRYEKNQASESST